MTSHNGRRGRAIAAALALGLVVPATAANADHLADETGICGQAADVSFPDVDSDGVFGPAIECVAGFGIVRGGTDGMFRPGDDVTRGEAAIFVARLVEISLGAALPLPEDNPFEDVGSGAAAASILKLTDAGIAQGTSETTYSPADTLTRGQTAAFLFRALDFIGVELDTTDNGAFTDADGLFADAINALNNFPGTPQVTNGFPDGTFRPGLDVTRGQLANFTGESVYQLDQVELFAGRTAPAVAADNLTSLDRPELVNVTTFNSDADETVFAFQFDEAVTEIDPDDFGAVAVDGDFVPADREGTAAAAVGSDDDPSIVFVFFPNVVLEDVVAFEVRAAGVTDLSQRTSPPGSFPYRDLTLDDYLGPDLVSIDSLDADANRVTVTYDEPIDETTDRTEADILLVLTDGTVIQESGTETGSSVVVVEVDGPTVTYEFDDGDVNSGLLGDPNEALDGLTLDDVARVVADDVLRSADDGRPTNVVPLDVNDPDSGPIVQAVQVDYSAQTVIVQFDRTVADINVSSTSTADEEAGRGLTATRYDGTRFTFNRAERDDDNPSVVVFSQPSLVSGATVTPVELDERTVDLELAADTVREPGTFPDGDGNLLSKVGDVPNEIERGRTIGPELIGLSVEVTDRDLITDEANEITLTYTFDEALAEGDQTPTGLSILEREGSDGYTIDGADGDTDTEVDGLQVTVVLRNEIVVEDLLSGVYGAFVIAPDTVSTTFGVGNYGRTLAF